MDEYDISYILSIVKRLEKAYERSENKNEKDLYLQSGSIIKKFIINRQTNTEEDLPYGDGGASLPIRECGGY